MSAINLGGLIIDNVTLDDAVERVLGYLGTSGSHIIVTPNPEIIVVCQKDAELKRIMNSASLRVPDGVSMLVVSRLLKQPLKQRVSGIDLMLRLCDVMNQAGKRIYLLGSAPGVANEASARLLNKYDRLQIVGTHDGYFSDDREIVEQIKVTKPDILFVGLGAGRQERWLNHHLAATGVPVGLAIGGSLDVISGRKKRAPRWVQKLYIEWLYRLFREPKRWKRQLALPKFLYLTLVKKVI
ncbi:MAG: WecB/TagA/CpsF family glycosyltransferase [Candidatus Saganbacteria bacterium]|nr:WecB/TagA/CpsF family glycosyltransferase [Candidatus Saganbacteria bacterium]